jgi:hypothetical protein
MINQPMTGYKLRLEGVNLHDKSANDWIEVKVRGGQLT